MPWVIPGGPVKPLLYSLKLHQFGDFEYQFVARKMEKQITFQV